MKNLTQDIVDVVKAKGTKPMFTPTEEDWRANAIRSMGDFFALIEQRVEQAKRDYPSDWDIRTAGIRAQRNRAAEYMRRIDPLFVAPRRIVVEFTPSEASALGAALTFALDTVGEDGETDSELRRVLNKLREAAR